MPYGKNIKVKVVGDGYEVEEDYRFYSKRYNRFLTVRAGMYSDGATCARDLKDTDAWLVHDYICRYAKWDDGTLIDNWTASTVLADELWSDGYKIEAITWWWATYLWGGGAARKNGMRRVK